MYRFLLPCFSVRTKFFFSSRSRKLSSVESAQRHSGGRCDAISRLVAARLQADAAHAGVARQWFRSPDVLALLPFDRPVPGQCYGLVWSVPDARAEELMALDDAAFEQALADATGGAAGSLRLCSERAAWPLTLARAETICGHGWVLLGDAALPGRISLTAASVLALGGGVLLLGGLLMLEGRRPAPLVDQRSW